MNQVFINRVLVLVVLGMCAGCGGGHYEVEPEADSSQTEIFQMLKDANATVTLDPDGKIIGVDLDSTDHGDDLLEKLKDIPTLVNLGLAGSGVTDAGMKHLHTMEGLKGVDLEDTKVTPRAVRQLKEALPDANIGYGGDDE